MKTIDRDTYLKALAMFTLGNQLYVEARELQLRMGDLLGFEEDGSCVDDALYSETPASVRDFNAALRKSGIAFEPLTVPNGEH